MKCASCFKSLPEIIGYEWDAVLPVGSVKRPHRRVSPYYECLIHGDTYCISCWVKKPCPDLFAQGAIDSDANKGVNVVSATETPSAA